MDPGMEPDAYKTNCFLDILVFLGVPTAAAWARQGRRGPPHFIKKVKKYQREIPGAAEYSFYFCYFFTFYAGESKKVKEVW